MEIPLQEESNLRTNSIPQPPRQAIMQLDIKEVNWLRRALKNSRQLHAEKDKKMVRLENTTVTLQRELDELKQILRQNHERLQVGRTSIRVKSKENNAPELRCREEKNNYSERNKSNGTLGIHDLPKADPSYIKRYTAFKKRKGKVAK